MGSEQKPLRPGGFSDGTDQEDGGKETTCGLGRGEHCLSEPQALLTTQQRKGLSLEEKKKHMSIADPSAQPSLCPQAPALLAAALLNWKPL